MEIPGQRQRRKQFPCHRPGAERPCCLTACETPRNIIGIDAFRQLALESENHRLVGTMSLARGSQRAEQFNPNAGYVIQEMTLRQPPDEHAGRPHRTDGVRTGRSNTDSEQIKDADGQGQIPLSNTWHVYILLIYIIYYMPQRWLRYFWMIACRARDRYRTQPEGSALRRHHTCPVRACGHWQRSADAAAGGRVNENYNANEVMQSPWRPADRRNAYCCR